MKFFGKIFRKDSANLFLKVQRNILRKDIFFRKDFYSFYLLSDFVL